MYWTRTPTSAASAAKTSAPNTTAANGACSRRSAPATAARRLTGARRRSLVSGAPWARSTATARAPQRGHGRLQALVGGGLSPGLAPEQRRHLRDDEVRADVVDARRVGVDLRGRGELGLRGGEVALVDGAVGLDDQPARLAHARAVVTDWDHRDDDHGDGERRRADRAEQPAAGDGGGHVAAQRVVAPGHGRDRDD